MKIRRSLLALLLSAAMLFSLSGCEQILDLGIALLEDGSETGTAAQAPTDASDTADTADTAETTAPLLDKAGHYNTKEDVALYLWTYKQLPENYITKNEARKLGWEGGTPERFAEDAAIGGDVFGNFEERLPEPADYRECDIDTWGKNSRGTKRIVYTKDCSRIYYTSDHYENFILLYPEE